MKPVNRLCSLQLWAMRAAPLTELSEVWGDAGVQRCKCLGAGVGLSIRYHWGLSFPWMLIAVQQQKQSCLRAEIWVTVAAMHWDFFAQCLP